jgi:hypothetical protein
LLPIIDMGQFTVNIYALEIVKVIFQVWIKNLMHRHISGFHLLYEVIYLIRVDAQNAFLEMISQLGDGIS